MSDIMRPISFKKLIQWILTEYETTQTIFGISEQKFYRNENKNYLELFDEKFETPIGPAAGPHTQLAQNIVSAYLTGGRFFELKTVQTLDQLEIEKPCIEAQDEGYNTEWSTELTVPQAYDEYIKAWIVLHFLAKKFALSSLDERGFIFNMSVGYDLNGIQTEKVDTFIEGLKDASENEKFNQYKEELHEVLGGESLDFVDEISPKICNSVTLSTMHGCPPEEQESICKYLIREKNLHTFVKLNSTLLGYERVRQIFDELDFGYIQLKEHSFTQDLQYDDAAEMIQQLKNFADAHNKTFGIKLSNTLPVVNTKGVLPTDEMYMSGAALFPLTITLAKSLAMEFDGDLNISYSGGANFFNISEIFHSGIYPITIATDLLKPGGYSRLTQMAKILESQISSPKTQIDLNKLSDFAETVLSEERYKKRETLFSDLKIDKNLGLFDCFVAPCVVQCPIHQDVPEYIRLIGEKRFDEAFDLIISTNPLPNITGYICDHKCMAKCVRNDYESPVLIRELKRIAAEKGYKTQPLRKPLTAKNVAIIGAGPAGISSAHFLARAGFDVTIFDKTKAPGGMVRHGIPDFRLPLSAIEKDIDLTKALGVKFQFDVDPDFSVDELKNNGFNYIVLAIGAWKSRELNLLGDNQDVMGGIEFLQAFKRNRSNIKLGKNVAVIGGGNSAMDSARAAKRVDGVENVYLIYRRTEAFMPADREEFENALADGVIFCELLSPVEFTENILKCQKMELGEFAADGRRNVAPIQNQYEEFQIDSVLAAIGELVDYDILAKNGIEFDEKGNISVNPETNETTVENVFIGGDAYRGPSTVVESMADGRKIADAIIAKERATLETVSAQDAVFDSDKRITEITGKKAMLRESGNEPLRDEDSIQRETERCLECNVICNKCVEVCPNRANIAIKIESENFADINQILHMDGMCNECGNCETFCPYQGAPYTDKFTLFWNETDFKNSENAGFILISDGDIIEFKVRWDSTVRKLIFNKTGEVLSDNFEEKISTVIWKIYADYGYLF